MIPLTTPPPPWDKAEPGDRVAAYDKGKWHGTRLAGGPLCRDGEWIAKPAGLPWMRLDLMRLGGMSCPGE